MSEPASGDNIAIHNHANNFKMDTDNSTVELVKRESQSKRDGGGDATDGQISYILSEDLSEIENFLNVDRSKKAKNGTSY